MGFISEFVAKANTFLWDLLLLILLCGTGIYFTIRLKFIQVRLFPKAFKETFGNISLKGAAAGADGMTSFQSLATSIAGQVGTGNLAGAAIAMTAGGPGAIFWMWVSAFFGMATIFVEATLAQEYKTTKDGEVVGGPVYYIRAAFKNNFGKFLAAAFAILIVIALALAGNMVQANSIGGAVKTAFGIPTLPTGFFLAALALFVFMGGRKRIASVTEKIVPIMAVFFVIASMIIIIINFKNIIPSFKMIFIGAFKPNAVLGGILGATVKNAIRYGVARGLFSNEAGMGSTPHAHAIAKVDTPCRQGLVAMTSVFIDTFVILPMTVFVILTTNSLDGTRRGIELTQYAFSTVFGRWGGIIIAVCIFFFAFSTIIGWYFFGASNITYLFGKKAIPFYNIIVGIFVAIGCNLKVDLVWDLSDLFNGLMIIPNLLALLALGGVAVKMANDFEKYKLNPLNPQNKNKN